MPKYVTQEHFDQSIGSIQTEVQGLQWKTDSIRGEMSAFRGDVAQRFDEVITILKRLEQERIFMVE